MRVLYIGQNSEGTTSRMRAEKIRNLIGNQATFEIIDTHIPYFKSSNLERSIGFRYKLGPLIGKINKYILNHVSRYEYDLIWVDKGIFITKTTTSILRSLTRKLVHFTPDPAFVFHYSTHFKNSCHLYDYLVTTKLYEIKEYKRNCRGEIIYCTQGYDKYLHYPRHKFEEKEGVVFVGHFERERGDLIKFLLEEGLKVKLAGIKWENFAKANRKNDNLTYIGKGIYGEEYANVISSALFALGSVSKWVPELHTTRTFEIPACGTALLTEENFEISSFYKSDEVIYYSNHLELIDKINYYMKHKDELKELTTKGTQKVEVGGFEYEEIIKRILNKIL
ncbi:CgeB family protein [Pontibacter ruber]|uniref:Glycosyltransferase n=1 Tax=Pontibacter ruber TaxID=1343895 RepID=A0ABW5CTR4_9BACT|nr:glycosyltransferase [Pontibacter ruber]